jgi:hypothetical protein
MPPIYSDDLKKRYRLYKETYRELKRQKFTTGEALNESAKIHNVTRATIKNALKNRPSKINFMNRSKN